MDFEGLSLTQTLDIQQFAQLAQRLVTYNLELELLDHQGEVVLPRPVTASPCNQAASPDGGIAARCHLERQQLCEAVLTNSQPRTIQCAGYRTLVGIPIRPFSTSLGVLLACQGSPHPFTTTVDVASHNHVPPTHPDGTDLIALLTTFLDQNIAAAIQRLEIDNLATELLDRYEQLNFVFDLARQVNPAGDPPRMFTLVTDKISQLFGADYVVTILHKDIIHYLTVAENTPTPDRAALTAMTQRLCQWVANQACPDNCTVVLNDIHALGWEEASTSLFTAVLATPIMVNNQCYGTLNILNMGSGRSFVNSDIAVVESVGKQVGIFLENHRLYQKLETLHQSQKMEALGRLAGSIAHDFKNILSAILGYGELTRDDLPEGSLPRENLDLMLKAGYRAKDLVQQILTFSRPQKQARQPVQVARIAQEVLTLLRASLPEAIELRQELDTTCGTILADPTQLHQVLMNLCTNASHAMSEQGGVLEVHLAEVEIDADFAVRQGVTEGLYVRLTVSDTGCGMPPGILAHIFEPFFTTKATSKGTGMGLAVVHGIVQSYNGTITVSSEPDHGTTFHVFLPSLKNSIVSGVTAAAAGLPKKKRLLLVDDDENIVHVGHQTLEHLGYEVVATTSSSEALDTFRTHPNTFDVVITDQIMPQITGDELAQELLRIRPNIPIILITGFSQLLSPERAKNLGIRAYLEKPLAADDLGTAIRRVLNTASKEI